MVALSGVTPCCRCPSDVTLLILASFEDCYEYYFRRFFKDDFDEPDINDYLPDSYYYLHDSDDYEPDSDDDYDLDN